MKKVYVKIKISKYAKIDDFGDSYPDGVIYHAFVYEKNKWYKPSKCYFYRSSKKSSHDEQYEVYTNFVNQISNEFDQILNFLDSKEKINLSNKTKIIKIPLK